MCDDLRCCCCCSCCCCSCCRRSWQRPCGSCIIFQVFTFCNSCSCSCLCCCCCLDYYCCCCCCCVLSGSNLRQQNGICNMKMPCGMMASHRIASPRLASRRHRRQGQLAPFDGRQPAAASNPPRATPPLTLPCRQPNGHNTCCIRTFTTSGTQHTQICLPRV